MKYNSIIKTGFFPVDEDGIYFRLFDKRRTRSSYYKIKGMIHPETNEVVIYSDVDDTFLIIETDKSVFFKLGSKLTRGMTSQEILNEGIERNILHSRVKFKHVMFKDMGPMDYSNRYYFYLRNI